MRGQERIKLKMGIDEPMRGRKVSSMINSVNQQNLEMNHAKSKELSTQDPTWKKCHQNTC
jgi:hypothetical protein